MNGRKNLSGRKNGKELTGTGTTKGDKKEKNNPRGEKMNGGKKGKKDGTSGRITKNTGRHGTHGSHISNQWKATGVGEETNRRTEEEKEDISRIIT